MRFARISQALLIFAVMAMQYAHAYGCDKKIPWSCFGSVEVSSPGKDSGTARLHVYSNNEFMAEIVGGQVDRKLLVAQPYTRLYFGVPDEEIKQGYAFAFFDYVFAWPLKALYEAFPMGPASVQADTTDQGVLLEGKVEGKLSVRRITASRVGYRLALIGDGDFVMTGYWDSEKPTPLPNDFSLARWRGKNLETFKSLLEARNASKDSKP